MAEEQTQAVETTQTVEPAAPAEKTYTQKEIDAMVGNIKKDAQAKLLKDLGVENVDNVKEALKQLKERQDAEKSEVDKLREQLAAAETTKAEAAQIRLELEAIKKGVPADKAEKVVKLAAAYDGNIDAVLAEFPEIVKGPAPAAQAFGAQTNPQVANEAEKLRNEIRAGLGLK